MIKYYKFRLSFYKIDSNLKSFFHVNNSEDASLISLITNEIAFDKLFNAITNNIGEEWLEVSEEDFNQIKQQLLIKINN